MRGESARPGKRPLRALSASEKMDAIQRVHEGESKASVARDIGVPESTLRGWCKSEHKIRGMARNSSTPDSEAHSPASSSGANALGLGASNLSSEDEAVGGPSAKKIKLDPLAGLSGLDNGDSDTVKLDGHKKSTAQVDYMNSIINSLVASGVRSENSSILLQQLGLLSSVQNSASLTKNLLGLSGSAALASSQFGSSGTTAQPVNLVENGLQYTKNSGGSNSHKRSSSSHISAIAPTTQLDAVSKSRKSLPAAAEAPSTPVPASPRKTGEPQQQQQQHHNGSINLQQAHSTSGRSSLGGSSRKDNGSSSSRKSSDDALWLWLLQQQFGQTAFNPTGGVDGSWFWQWYKQCTFPNLMPDPLAQPHSTTNNGSKKSPSKSKAVLDNVLNNNDNVKRSLNLSVDAENKNSSEEKTSSSSSGTEDHHQQQQQQEEEGPTLSLDEAIEHGETFFKWLEKCSDPSVTRVQLIQFKYLLDSLKSSKLPYTHAKQSRK